MDAITYNPIQIMPPPIIAATSFALDDPRQWERYSAFEAPCPPDEVAMVQTEIDGIIGQTRGNKSIAKLVWNGDIRFWKEFHNCWDTTGRPIGDTYKRPQVLYKSIFNESDIFIRDAFPPRWLILTRIEIEQYAPTWAKDSRFSHPDFGVPVQILPSEIPAERHVWFMTVALHVGGCCQIAARDDHTCWGRYAHPRFALDELRNIRKGMEASGLGNSHPFDSPDQLTERMRDYGNNDYIAQAMSKFIADRQRAIDMTPIAVAGPGTTVNSADLKQLRSRITEQAKRDADIYEKELKKRKIT